MHVLVATDAWEPQVNGVVRTLRQTAREAAALGAAVEVVTPAMFRTVPMPGYREIRLALVTPQMVARAVAASRVPTLVAIGHEIDLSLAELAADKRASTPSNASAISTSVRPSSSRASTNGSCWRTATSR